MTREQEIVGLQWPKRCGCGQVYAPEQWLQMEFAYFHRDAFAVYEARHCSCQSTLMVILEILDLLEE